MWTNQAWEVLGEDIERMEREHRLFEEIGREEMFRRRDEFQPPAGSSNSPTSR